MAQIHYQQFGLFHVVTNAKDRIPWCTWEGVPDRLLQHLFLARDIHKAHIHAFCILPDHIHLLLSPGPKGLSRFMQSFTSCSTKGLKKVDSRIGWQAGFYDERIRDSDQRGKAFYYIEGNGMKHGLVSDIADWPWSSLHFRDVCDPMEIWT